MNVYVSCPFYTDCRMLHPVHATFFHLTSAFEIFGVSLWSGPLMLLHLLGVHLTMCNYLPSPLIDRH